MSRYRVTLTSSAGFYITVEADSEDEAIDLAYDEAPSGVCAHCSGYGQEWSLDLGDDWEHIGPVEEDTDD